jgi:hypothetical protein
MATLPKKLFAPSRIQISKFLSMYLLIQVAFAARAEGTTRFSNTSERAVASKDSGKQIVTNSVVMQNAPAWLTQSKVQSVVDRTEQRLEWSTRKIEAYWYPTQESLEDAFGFRAPTILAFMRRSDQSLHFGPKTTSKNFAVVFAHELGHVIISQKYKNSIPSWIEEGLVNKIAGNTRVNYKFLKNYRPREDVNRMSHPFDAKSMEEVNFKYQAALAAVLMLEKKCPNFRELINLSLKQNLETFIPTYCSIPDVNTAFWQWVDLQAIKSPK